MVDLFLSGPEGWLGGAGRERAGIPPGRGREGPGARGGGGEGVKKGIVGREEGSHQRRTSSLGPLAGGVKEMGAKRGLRLSVC